MWLPDLLFDDDNDLMLATRNIFSRLCLVLSAANVYLSLCDSIFMCSAISRFELDIKFCDCYRLRKLCSRIDETICFFSSFYRLIWAFTA